MIFVPKKPLFCLESLPTIDLYARLLIHPYPPQAGEVFSSYLRKNIIKITESDNCRHIYLRLLIHSNINQTSKALSKCWVKTKNTKIKSDNHRHSYSNHIPPPSTRRQHIQSSIHQIILIHSYLPQASKTYQLLSMKKMLFCLWSLTTHPWFLQILKLMAPSM